MNVLRWPILITSLLLLSGCASLDIFKRNSVKPIEVQTKAVERTRLNLSDPSPLKPPTLNWVLVTPENAEVTWAKLKEQNADLVIIGLTDDGYENLAILMAEIRTLINSQRQIILKYKEYYEPQEVLHNK